MSWETVMGLEVHLQLATNRKFSRLGDEHLARAE